MIGPHTVADWLALEPPADGSRLELIFGYLHQTPAPTGEHQAVAFNVAVLLRDAVRTAGRADLHVVPAVNVRISTAWRTALIPDVAVLNCKPSGVSFPATSLMLAVEVWSPGNSRDERETKLAGYAAAGVPFVWTIDQLDRQPTLTAHRLVNGQHNDHYVAENVLQSDGPITITAAPFPITLDLAEVVP